MSKLKHFKEFETYGEYETYINGNPMLPNVSFVGENVYYKDGVPTPEEYYFNFGVDTSEVESTDTSIINTYDTNYPSITFEYNGIVTGITDNNGNITANFNENTIEEQQTGSVIAKHNDTIVGTWTITQKAYEKPDYSKQYLTFKIIEDGEIYLNNHELEYSTDGGETWVSTSSTISVVNGDVLMFKGINRDIFNLFSDSTAGFEIEGNIMSLIYGDDFIDKIELAENDTFSIFSVCTGLTSAENLILPATTLKDDCYYSMFYYCTSLVTAPELPATTLADGCYYSMFEGCTSLVTAPELPATTLASNCYSNMFAGCTSLVTAPELPATTLALGCYAEMFSGCTSLTTAPELPATTLADNCYYSMFSGCTSLTTAPELPATTLADSCYAEMFIGCTSLVTAPSILPATTLASNCYSNMFAGCTSLVTAPELPATTLAQYCYYSMFIGCTSLVTAPELPATTLALGCYYSMFEGCTSLVTASELPATTLAQYCYYSMFIGCTSLVTASELPATTLANGCYQSMFNGCTSLVTAPELPATTLAQYCYYSMFYGCTSLNYIKCLATNISASNCLYQWVRDITSSGTFVKAAGVTWPTGINGIPSGWVVQEV